MGEDNKQARIKLFRWLATQKCPGCQSIHKIIDVEEDIISCECEKCGKQWKLKRGN